MITAPLAEHRPRGQAGGRAPRPAYAAIMVTPGHGVQWQSDFSHDGGRLDRPRPALAQADPRRVHGHRLRVAPTE